MFIDSVLVLWFSRYPSFSRLDNLSPKMDNLDRLQQFTNMKSGDLGVLAPILTSIYSNFAVRLQHNLSRDMLYPHKSSIHIPLCSIPLICLKYISLKHLLSRAIPIFYLSITWTDYWNRPTWMLPRNDAPAQLRHLFGLPYGNHGENPWLFWG